MLTLIVTLAVTYIAVYAYNLFAWEDLAGQITLYDIPYHVQFTVEHVFYSARPLLDALYNVSRELVELFTDIDTGVFLNDEGLIAIRESLVEVGLYDYNTGARIESAILWIVGR